MKRPYTLRLLLAVVAALAYVITSSATIRHTAVFDNTSVSVASQLSGSDSVSVLTWPGMLPDGALPGAPELQGKQLKFIVPANAANFRISVKNAANGRNFELPHILQPVQQPITTNEAGSDIEPTPANPQYYTHIAPSAKIADDGYADGDNHVLTLWIVPMDYEPAQNRVTCYGSLDIEIEYDEVAGIFGSQRPITPAVQTTISADWRKEIANSADISRYGARRTSTQVQVPGYLIITSADLMDSFRELADWKRQKGYRVTQTCIDDILSNPRYADGDTVTGVNDDAGKMRAYLMDYYRQNGRSYVLFGGDYTKVPIRYGYNSEDKVHFDSDTTFHFVQIGPVPTDWYFTELNSNWDFYKDGILGDMNIASLDRISSDSELTTGRLLCSKPTHVKTYIKKLIRYESNPGNGNVDYLNNSFHFVYPEFSGVIQQYEQYWPVNCEVLYGLPSDNPNAPYPTGTQVMDSMSSKPYGYISMNGHGEPGEIASAAFKRPWGDIKVGIKIIGDYKLKNLSDTAFNSFNNGLDRLKNYDSPSIAYSVACDCAPFDRLDNHGTYYEDNIYEYEFNMASGFTCAGEWGGPAFIGNTRISYYLQNKFIQSAFVSAMSRDPNIGLSHICSKTIHWDDLRHRYMGLTNNLIGDPELQMWIGAPKFFNATVAFEDNKISINSAALEDAFVSFWDGNNTYSRLILDNTSEFSTVGNENKSIFISKRGYLPLALFCGFDKTLDTVFPHLNLNYALLGAVKNKKFSIINGGSLNLTVTKKVNIGPGFEVGTGGTVLIQCDGDVNINGGFIQSGGKLIIRAKNITINSSFTAESGANVTIEQL